MNIADRLAAIHKAESEAGGYVGLMMVKKRVYRWMLPLIRSKLEFALEELGRLEKELR